MDFGTSFEFWSRDKEEMWEAVKKSGIVLEKRVNLGDDPPVANKVPLQRVEWSSMLSPKDYFYPKLVRYFYCNLHKHDPFRHCFAVSYIRGYRMNLTAATLAQVLHLPIEGTEQDFTDEQKSISRLVSQSVVNDLICARAVGNWQPRSSDLNFDCKGPPQHCQHQRPPIGGGHREVVLPGYAFVLYCLFKGIKLNLPHLM